MKKNTISKIITCIVVSLLLLTVQGVSAEPKTGSVRNNNFSFFVGGGYKNFLNAQNTFDTLYDSAGSVLFDAGMKLDLKGGFFVSAEAYLIMMSGERVWVSSDGTYVKTGITEDLNLIPISATLGYYLYKSDDLKVYLGAGAGFYLVQIDCEIDDYDRNESGSGIFGVLGADYLLSDAIYIGLEAKYESVTGLIGDSGVPAVFEEDDLGGIIVLIKLGFNL